MVQTKEAKATKGSLQRARRFAGGEGAAMITALADLELKQQCHELMATLIKNALKGNVSCTRLWVYLSEKSQQANSSDKKGSEKSLANMWAAEPEWTGESSEVGAEMASGSREPEN